MAQSVSSRQIVDFHDREARPVVLFTPESYMVWRPVEAGTSILFEYDP